MNARQTARRCTLEAVASIENLFHDAAKARRGKSRRPDVEDWWLRRETEILSLRQELLSGAYQPGPYHFFEIFEPKRRLIAAAPFRDRVVHHALCNRMAPLLERTFIARSFSCQIGKGATAARECCRQLVNRHRFVFKCDVRKFFPNIDHVILFDKLAALLHCEGVMELIRKILGSYQESGERGAGLQPAQWTNNGQVENLPNVAAPLFAGDDLVAVAARPRGLPIGNLTSQLWGNFYLDGLDHGLTEQERHGAYLRYTDDFLLFSDDKERLWALHACVRQQLAAVRLKLAEPKSRLLATAEGVPFCGFRFLPDLRPRVLGPTKRRFERRRYQLARSKVGRICNLPNHPSSGNPSLGRLQTCPTLTLCVFSWYQFSREANSEGLRRAYCQWPLDARLKRRRRKTARVLRGGSWNNDNPDNFLASNRNNNNPDNRNDNNGFRCAGVGVGGSSPKAIVIRPMPGGSSLPGQCQEDTSLTAAPVPVPATGKDAARAVAGNPESFRGESHGPLFSEKVGRVCNLPNDLIIGQVTNLPHVDP